MWIAWIDIVCRNFVYSMHRLWYIGGGSEYLHGVRWMKSYLSAEVLKATFGGEIAVTTIRKWQNYWLEKIASLREFMNNRNWLDNGIYSYIGR